MRLTPVSAFLLALCHFPFAVSAQVPSTSPATLLAEATEAKSLRLNAATDVEIYSPVASWSATRDTMLYLLNTFSDPITVELTFFSPGGQTIDLGSATIPQNRHLTISLKDAVGASYQQFHEGTVRVAFHGDTNMLQSWLILRRLNQVIETRLVPTLSTTDLGLLSFWDTSGRFRSALPHYYLQNVSPDEVVLSVTEGRSGDSATSPRAIQRTITIPPHARATVTPRVENKRGWLRVDGSTPGQIATAALLEGAVEIAALPLQALPALAEDISSLPFVRGPHADATVAIYNPGDQPSHTRLSLVSQAGTVLASQDVVLPANTVRSLSVPRDLGGTTDAASAADRIAITTDTPLLLQGTSDVGADVPVDMVFAAEEYAHQNGSYPIPAPSQFEVYTDFVNVSSEPARVRGQLSWEDGTYSLAPFTIPAHSSYRLWYDNVAGSGDLDLLERKVPADFQHGFFQWSAHGSKGMLLARTHIRPRSGKDSWGFNCYGCCWEYPFGILVPDSVSFNIGGNPYFTASEIDNTCSGQIGPYPADSPVLSYGSPVSWNGSLVSSSNYTSQMLSFSAEAGRVSPTCNGASVTIHGSGPVVVDQCYKNNHPGGTPGAGCNQQTGGCTDCFACCDQDKEVAKCRCTQAGQNCAATAAAACGTCKQQCFGTFAENCESQNLGCTQ